MAKKEQQTTYREAREWARRMRSEGRLDPFKPEDFGIDAPPHKTTRANLQEINLVNVEEWREYDFAGRVYRIEKPTSVAFREGGATHRVTDSTGVVHCVPAPGNQGCVLRWKGAIVA